MTSNTTTAGTLLVFDAQLTNLTKKALQKLRSSVLSNPKCEWIIDVVASLPSFWDTASAAVPKLHDETVPTLLADLDRWMQQNEFAHASLPLPNVLLTPITVMNELVQFANYLEHEGLGWKDLQETHETLGFCTGLLSAFVVSSSKDYDSFKEHGSAALRLATLIGALVDGHSGGDMVPSRSTSISVGWNSEDQKGYLDEALERLEEVYISVTFDERRATLTGPHTMVETLSETMTRAGLSVIGLELRGCFHTSLHQDNVDLLKDVCSKLPSTQLPQADSLVLKTKDNVRGEDIQQGRLHEVALEGILSSPCNWYQTCQVTFQAMQKWAAPRVLCFGLARPIPSAIAAEFGIPIAYAKNDLDLAPAAELSTLGSSYTYPKPISGEEIAVIGMACKTAGADDLEEFWRLLCKAESQHQEIKDGFRFDFKTAHRADGDAKRKWFGNFIEDAAAFDHKFWRKSPREAASTDPQQRLMMSVALQAVIQSGYFHSTTLENHHVGCYLGIGNVDYEENINHHEPTAFMATGNLRSFIAGKISHALGWTGPALTIDTACSSSGVAVHQACRAILSGECTAALAGGAAIMSSPRMFQDLAAASFLSPTGPCKSFDAAADGYCRGEGVGAVFLKKLSQAIEDGDQIYGVVASSAVYQNQNHTAITVPNAPSLSGLFGDVAKKACVKPSEVTFVEAHGTGTQVGDPAEWEGVRRVYGGDHRTDTLSVGSVKAVVGHTEGAAGIVSLIKVLLMIHQGTITPQSNFKAINPAINSQPSDNMEVSTRLRPWKSTLRAAMINSYGASGSNASMIVTQPPRTAGSLAVQPGADRSHPFWFCALDERSVQAYAAKFLGYLLSTDFSTEGRSIANLSFNVARQTNRWLPRALVFESHSVDDLVAKLSAYISGDASVSAVTRTVIHPETRPVILCFGGQVATFVGLDRELYDGIKLLRRNLDECDTTIQAAGFGSIFPGIFQRHSMTDTLNLQIALFSLQYSVAKTWLDCGLHVAAVVGHSFGELTALAVSGALSLQDTIHLIGSRAKLIRDDWGSDKGAMMAVEGSLNEIEKLLASSNAQQPGAGVACFNGPTSFTLAGPTAAIDAFEEIAKRNEESTRIKSKRLSVTNAFHSTLVEPLMGQLENVAKGLEFCTPLIPLERATKDSSHSDLGPRFVAEHLRSPVYFHQAVERLAEKHPNAVWLEAGSQSSVTSMAKKALGSPAKAFFQSMNLTSDKSWSQIISATMNLWLEGINVPFWAHHSIQTTDYSPLLLPPYQFEKQMHWLERKPPAPLQASTAAPAPTATADDRQYGLWKLMGYNQADQRAARFRVNTLSKEFEEILPGSGMHALPFSAQMQVVVEAHLSLSSVPMQDTSQANLMDVETLRSLSVDSRKSFWLDTELLDTENQIWEWKIVEETVGESLTCCSCGKLRLLPATRQSNKAFDTWDRIIDPSRCKSLFEDQAIDTGLQGRSIHRLEHPAKAHGDKYRSLQRIAGKGNECAATLAKTSPRPYHENIFLADGFFQVTSIFLNCMTDNMDCAGWILSRMEQRLCAPDVPASNTWEVYSRYHRNSDEWIADVFVFNAETGMLAEVILGLHYRAMHTEGRHADTVSTPEIAGQHIEKQRSSPTEFKPESSKAEPTTGIESRESPAEQASSVSEPNEITSQVLDLLADLSGIDAADIQLHTELPDIGIDSLMSMELARDIEKMFECTVVVQDMNEVLDVQSLIVFIQKCLGIDQQAASGPTKPSVAIDSSTSSQTNGLTTFTPSSSASRSDDIATLLPQSLVRQVFEESKGLTDEYISRYGFAGYSKGVMPKQNDLCVVHILDALDQLGVSMRSAKPGEQLTRVAHHPRHERFVSFIYDSILHDAGVVRVENGVMTRGEASLPVKSAGSLLEELLKEAPEHSYDHRLTYLAGSRLAEVLKDTCDGVQLLFASSEGREAVTGMYSKSPVNVVWIKQIEAFIKRLLKQLDLSDGPLKILELGAGTGGTTARMVDIIATLGLPVEYTVTDLSPSLVAAARKRFRGFDFLKYQSYDIEKPPSQDLQRSQHLVLATNCVHATRSLETSTRNVHQLLRPDGCLLMLEMTETIPWIDLVFGTLEGWWVFEDGRTHALVSSERWKEVLQSVGYGYVDWTSGVQPEASIQRVILAMAS